MLTMLPLTTQMYGGMRGIRGLVTETSLLDPEEVRGQRLPGNHTITAFVCRESVSVVTVSRSYRSSCRRGQEGRSHYRREYFFSCSPGRSLVGVRSVGTDWCLYIACLAFTYIIVAYCGGVCVPITSSRLQVDSISADWAARADLPQHVVQMVANFPNTLHPMSQFSSAISAMQLESKFARAYAEGMPKTKYWEVSSLPPLCSLVIVYTFFSTRLMMRWTSLLSYQPLPPSSTAIVTMMGKSELLIPRKIGLRILPACWASPTHSLLVGTLPTSVFLPHCLLSGRADEAVPDHPHGPRRW